MPPISTRALRFSTSPEKLIHSVIKAITGYFVWGSNSLLLALANFATLLLHEQEEMVFGDMNDAVDAFIQEFPFIIDDFDIELPIPEMED